MQEIIDDRYELIKTLGKGSFGEVFEARDNKLHRLVALKRFFPEAIANSQLRDAIENEARLMARFKHPNILGVIEYQVTDDLGYIVTDLAEGGSLEKKIRAVGRQPVRFSLLEVTRYLEQIALGLYEAHSKIVAHRDLKPANILLAKDGHAMIADFGLAAVLGDNATMASLHLEGGTPSYMAPEQWENKPRRVSDIYALGIITFQLLTGKLPYGGNAAQLLNQHLHTPMPLLREVAPELNYPAALDDVIAAATEKEWDKRIRSPLEYYGRFREVVIAASNDGLVTSFPPPPPKFSAVLPPEESSKDQPSLPLQPEPEPEPPNPRTERLLKQARLLRMEQEHRLKSVVDAKISAAIKHDLKDLEEQIQKFEAELNLNLTKPTVIEAVPDLSNNSVQQSSLGEGLETEGKHS